MNVYFFWLWACCRWVDFYFLEMTLNSFVHCCPSVWQLNCGHVCVFRYVDEAVSGGKPPARKGVDSLSWHGLYFWVCITFCKVRHSDSVTKPDYYFQIIIQFQSLLICTEICLIDWKRIKDIMRALHHVGNNSKRSLAIIEWLLVVHIGTTTRVVHNCKTTWTVFET